jgi:hypothetical protein
MKKLYAYVLEAAVLLALPGLSLAHHGTAEDLGGQLVHATFAPSHLGVTLLAAGALFVAYRLACRFARAYWRRP